MATAASGDDLEHVPPVDDGLFCVTYFFTSALLWQATTTVSPAHGWIYLLWIFTFFYYFGYDACNNNGIHVDTVTLVTRALLCVRKQRNVCVSHKPTTRVKRKKQLKVQDEWGREEHVLINRNPNPYYDNTNPSPLKSELKPLTLNRYLHLRFLFLDQ